MPTVLRSGPYRLYFYSGDRSEPPHVHVERDDRHAKLWLAPVRIQESGGFSRIEIARVRQLVEENAAILLQAWHDHFSE